MAREFLGKGWSFPVRTNLNEEMSLSTYEDDIKEAIWIIISTAKGERVMRPDFGCGIHDLVFAPIDAVTLNEVENTIHEALLNFEPRIEVLNVSVSDEEAENGKLLIRVDYRIKITNSEFNMVYPFYLKEGML